MALKSNGVTQVPDGLGLPGKVLRVNSSGTAGEWGDAVDGRNSVSDGTKLDSIEAGATADQTKADIEGLGIDVPATNLTGTIPAARLSTATTQAESDDSTKIATTAYVVDKITTLIGGAPSTLNDLNELAAAINDDANYNTTLTTALGTKLPLAGGTITGDVSFGDNNKAIFGAGSDLQIYHDGTHSYIKDAGTGYLKLGLSNAGTAIQNASGTNLLVTDAYAVSLRYNGGQKLNTSAAGITVTGNATFADNGKAIFGAGSDLQIYHDGNNGYIKNDTGKLILDSQTGITIDCNNVTNQTPILISNMGAGGSGIILSRTASGTGHITIGDSMDHSRPMILSGTNKSLGFIVRGALGNAAYAAFDFTVDANASNRHPAVMGVRSANNNSLIFQGEQSDSTVVFSVDYDGNVATSGTVDGVDIAARDAILTSTTTTAGAALPKAGGTLTGNLAISNTTPVLSINDTNNGSGGGFIGHIEFNNTSGESFRIGDWAAVDETSTGGPDVLRLRNSNGTRTVFEWGQAGTTAGSLYAYNQRVFADNYHPNADTLTTARTINGVAFNGSTNITIADATKLPLAGGTITGDLTVNDTLIIASNNVGSETDIAFTAQAAVVGENNMSFGLTNNTDGYYRWMFGNTTNTGGTAGATEKMKLDKDGNLTLSGTVDGRDLAADGNKLDDIETGATADQTAAQILTAIKTVDGSSSGLDADNLDGVTWGNINTTLQTSTNIKAYNGTTEIKSDGIYFESGNHCITWNDGKGNFNIRVANNTNEVSTETGYASHIEWSQSSGWMQVNATNASVVAGNAVTWNQTWQYTFSNGQFSSPGDIVAYSSDRRLKTNIKNIDNALDKVLKLNGVYFNWADDINDKGFYGANPGEIAVGVIAQEVEVVLPELVAPAPFDQHHDTETGEALGSKSGQDYKTVKYEKLTALLIEAVKELSAKVDLPQEEIDRLKRQ